jgi:hypothetical protein
MRVAPGDKVVFPRNNVEKCGNVISAARDRDEAVAMAERAANMILIRLEPGNEETEAFLFDAPFGGDGDEAAFPPPAIQKWADGEWRDYTGRTLEEVGAVVETLTGRSLPSSARFEDALVRGGYQGGVYYMDTHAPRRGS